MLVNEHAVNFNPVLQRTSTVNKMEVQLN